MEDPLVTIIGAFIGLGIVLSLLGWLSNGLAVVLTVTLTLLDALWRAAKRLWKRG